MSEDSTAPHLTVRRKNDFVSLPWNSIITAAVGTGDEQQWYVDNGLDYNIYKRRKVDWSTLPAAERPVFGETVFDATSLKLISSYLTFRDVCRLRQTSRHIRDVVYSLTSCDLKHNSSSTAMWDYCTDRNKDRNTVDNLIMTKHNVADIIYAVKSDARSLNCINAVTISHLSTVLASIQSIVLTPATSLEIVCPTWESSCYKQHMLDRLATAFPQVQTLVLTGVYVATTVYQIVRPMSQVTNLCITSLNPPVLLSNLTFTTMTELKRLALYKKAGMLQSGLLMIVTYPLIELECHYNVPADFFVLISQSTASASLRSVIVNLDHTTPLQNQHFDSPVQLPELRCLALHQYDLDVARSCRNKHLNVPEGRHWHMSPAASCEMDVIANILASSPRLRHLEVFVNGWYINDLLPHVSNDMLLRLQHLSCSISSATAFAEFRAIHQFNARSRLKLLYLYSAQDRWVSWFAVNVACTRHNTHRTSTQFWVQMAQVA